MTVNETIVTGRKFRKLIDEATKLWQRISFWTKASDVEFDDGSDAETKFGAINGITDSLTSTSSNIAASAAAVKALNDKVTELNSNIFNGIKHQGTVAAVDNTSSTSAKLTFDTSGILFFEACHGYPANRTPNPAISIDGNATQIGDFSAPGILVGNGGYVHAKSNTWIYKIPTEGTYNVTVSYGVPVSVSCAYFLM